MSAHILDHSHWQAARGRRDCRARAAERALYAGPKQPKWLTLDEIMGTSFDRPGGAA